MTYGKKGLFVRITYLAAAIIFFIFGKVRRRVNRGVIVLCYHGVNDAQRLRFEHQVHMIQHRVVSSRTMSSFVSDKKILSICLTFDDAFVNLMDNVIPVITKLRIPITIFIPTGNLGSTPAWLKKRKHPDSQELVLSAEQLSILKDNLMISFGSHTVDHPQLSQLNEKAILDQLKISREMIAKIIDQEITELALPHGDYNDAVLRLAFAAGYRNIYTLEPKVNMILNHTEPQVLGRFSVSPDDWPIEFYLTVQGAYAWLASWRAFLRCLRH